MKLLTLLLLCTAPLAAQLQVYTVQGTVERAVSGILAMGTTPTGEPLDVVVRLKNPAGSSLAVINTLSVSGIGFSVQRVPTIPIGLVGGFALDFIVRYASDQATADVRGTLQINTATISLIAGADAAPYLYLVEQDGSRTRKLIGDSAVFGTVERGDQVTRRFVVENPHSTDLTVRAMAVNGDSFRPAGPIILPIDLAAGSSRNIDIVFQPTSSTLRTGSLVIDDRKYLLEGLGRDAIPSRPSLTIDAESPQNGKQLKVSVKLEAVARSDTAGRVRVEFTSAFPGPDDPAVIFVATNSRTIPFLVKAGDSLASFGSQQSALLQTGTTAGSFRVIAELGGFSNEASFSIGRAPVVVDQLAVRRSTGSIEATVRGFDNSRSTNEVAFTFFDDTGNMVQPGELRVTVASQFQKYFETTPSGGMFAMTALFPATTSTIHISGAILEFKNSIGVTRTERLAF